MTTPMKSRVVRVSDEIWQSARERASERGESVSTAMRRFLTNYAKDDHLRGFDLHDVPDGIEPLMVMVVVNLHAQPAEELAEAVARQAAEAAREAVHARLGKGSNESGR